MSEAGANSDPLAASVATSIDAPEAFQRSRRGGKRPSQRRGRGGRLSRGLRDLVRTHPDIALPQIRIGLQMIKLEYSGFVADVLHDLFERHVVEPVKLQMRLGGIHEKIVQGTHLGRVRAKSRRRLTYTIVSSYKAASGFNVAAMVEYGRKPYVVYPVHARRLHWRDKDTGEDIYAKESHIPAWPARQYIARTVASARPIVQEELDRATEEWVRRTLGLDRAPPPPMAE